LNVNPRVQGRIGDDAGHSAAADLDAVDPLASYRDQFVVTDPSVVYLDGNSLGRLPRRTVEVVRRAVDDEWGAGLVESWDDWIFLPTTLGNAIAPLIGAEAGEVVVCDQTSVNLYKLAAGAVAATGRSSIVTDDTNFPSDRYVLDGVTRRGGGELRVAKVDPVAGPGVEDLAPLLDGDVAVVALSHVGYRSAAIADMAAITELAHRHGALALWDLSHSAGAVPVDLAGAGADMAVGCTYKHLNGGPGAPAYLYVRRSIQDRMDQPIHGWFGHDDMFEFEATYRPAPGMGRFAVGTPPILSMRAVEPGVALVAAAGVPAIRAKGRLLTGLLIDLFDERLAPLGFGLGSPRDPTDRASHVTLTHPEAYRLTRLARANRLIVDYRVPNALRLGVAALYTRFTEVAAAVEILGALAAAEAWHTLPAERSAVT
jgi:kynureninase